MYDLGNCIRIQLFRGWEIHDIFTGLVPYLMELVVVCQEVAKDVGEEESKNIIVEVVRQISKEQSAIGQ